MSKTNKVPTKKFKREKKRNEMFHQGGDECCSTANQCGAGEVTRLDLNLKFDFF